MALPERTSGLYRLITFPFFYKTFMRFLGAESARERLLRDWYKPTNEMDILDIGCGPGVMAPLVKSRSYLGVDINSAHIESAQQNFGNTSVSFRQGAAQDLLPRLSKSFDLIICSGFLHHVDDAGVAQILQAAQSALRPGGYVVIVEPVYLPKQRWIARQMKSWDSGQHIRTASHWRAILPEQLIEERISGDLLNIPYDHIWFKLGSKAS
jgi:SAM-dependent methyltransferase